LRELLFTAVKTSDGREDALTFSGQRADPIQLTSEFPYGGGPVSRCAAQCLSRWVIWHALAPS
jgi:hypothetical protein